VKEVLALSGVRQAGLIRRGEISAAELVRAHLERIAEVNPRINAGIEILGVRALAEAAEVDRRRAGGELSGHLAGVPFSIKDSIEVNGTVCSAGTLGFRGNAPSAEDATLVARLRAAGAIPLARTNLPDLLFAFESDNLIFGRSNNPYALERTPGGSSGGEAALIAACGSPFGLGSDAAGSVRLPAHFSGITAIKPTSGRLPRTGHVPPAGGWIEAIWQIGPMARRVEDLCVLMPLLVGPDGWDRTVAPAPFEDPRRLDVDKLRIAFFTDNGVMAPDAATAAVVRRAAAEVGARECRPPLVEHSYDLEMRFLGPDGGDGLRDYAKAIGSFETHPLLEGWLRKLERCRTTVAGFAQLWAELDEFRNAMFGFLRDYDAVLSPVAAFPALEHGRSTEDAVFPGFSYTMTHNLTGWPAAVVRCGATAGGLPIGVQIAAPPWREDIALAVALRLEEALGGWSEPPI
jgi:amidase